MSAGARAAVDFHAYIRDIPDFPREGIVFRDITPLLGDGDAFAAAVSEMACFAPQDADTIVGIESRGFIFGAALAFHLNLGFVPVRKPGKLPGEVEAEEFELEYGVDRLEIHRDALAPGKRAIVVDDVLATGGTALATVRLVRRLGAEVAACLFFLELVPLEGRKRLEPDVPVFSVLPLS